MDLTLRPGEKLVLRWDNIGKVAAGKLTNDSSVACDEIDEMSSIF